MEDKYVVIYVDEHERTGLCYHPSKWFSSDDGDHPDCFIGDYEAAVEVLEELEELAIKEKFTTTYKIRKLIPA